MRFRFIGAIVVATAATVGLVACGDDADDSSAARAEAPEATAVATTAPATTMAPAAGEAGTIVDVAAGAGSFNTLVAAVEAAGLTEALSGEGPFTVFAPTDEAFAAALEALDVTSDELLADTETLTSILTYHVIPGEVPSSKVVTMDGQTAPTVNGAELTISIDGETVRVNDATVTAVDIGASNGLIHVIDSVLVPPAS